jgi:hypothetical protein
MLVAYFKERHEITGYPVYLTSEPHYKRSIKYLMEKASIPLGSFNMDNRYQEGLYYLVLRTEGNIEANYQKYLPYYDVVSVKPFGTLSVIELVPKANMLVGIRQDLSVPPKKADSKAPPRYTWREFLAGGAGVGAEDDEEALNEEN